MGSIKIEPIQRLQSCFGHANRAGIALWTAMVAFITPFPDSVIGYAVSPSDVVDQILDEVGFVPTPDHGTSASS